MSTATITPPELSALFDAYSQATERLQASHKQLVQEVSSLRVLLDEKNRELARQERLAALGEMAAGVAHEVRNPLGAIRLYASMLESDLADQPDSLRVTQKIATAVDGLNELVGNILAFAQTPQVEFETLPLWDVLEEAIELARPQIDANKCQLTVDETIRDITVRGDDHELSRALLNLLLNGVDAAGENGKVQIQAAESQDGLTGIRIADSGPGIPEDLMQRIFNPFFTTRDEGTGLGLSIVHRVIESHQGRIMVRNQENSGAEFTIYLPQEDRRPNKTEMNDRTPELKGDRIA